MSKSEYVRVVHDLRYVLRCAITGINKVYIYSLPLLLVCLML